MEGVSFEHTVRFIREEQDANREKRGDPPITDRELVNILLSMRFHFAAEWLLGQMYAEAV